MLPTSVDWNGEILFYKDIHIRITDLSTHWLFVWLPHNIKTKFIILATTKAVQQLLVFRVTGHLCGEFTGPGEFPAQRTVTQSFDVFFDLRLNKRLSVQSWGWWLETQSHPLCRQCNESFVQIMSTVEKNSRTRAICFILCSNAYRNHYLSHQW